MNTLGRLTPDISLVNIFAYFVSFVVRNIISFFRYYILHLVAAPPRRVFLCIVVALDTSFFLWLAADETSQSRRPTPALFVQHPHCTKSVGALNDDVFVWVETGTIRLTPCLYICLECAHPAQNEVLVALSVSATGRSSQCMYVGYLAFIQAAGKGGNFRIWIFGFMDVRCSADKPLNGFWQQGTRRPCQTTG